MVGEAMPLTVYLDWVAFVELAEGHHPRLRQRLLDLRDAGRLALPFTPAHIMEAAEEADATPDAGPHAARLRLGHWLGHLSLLSGDRYWSLEAPWDDRSFEARSPYQVHAEDFFSQSGDRARREQVASLFDLILPRLEESLRELGSMHDVEVEDLVADLRRTPGDPSRRIERFLALVDQVWERAGVETGDPRLGDLGDHLEGLLEDADSGRVAAGGRGRHASLAMGVLIAGLGLDGGSGRPDRSALKAGDLHLQFGLRADLFVAEHRGLRRRAQDAARRGCRVLPLGGLGPALPG